MIAATLITGLAFVTVQAVATTTTALIAGLAFIAELPRGLAGRNALFQLFNFELDFGIHVFHLLPMSMHDDKNCVMKYLVAS
jgi:hypothetical protein